MLYVGNATQMWSRLGSVSETSPGHMRFETSVLSRVILLEATDSVDDLLAQGSRRVSLEDSFGTSKPPAVEGVRIMRMPIMDCSPGPVEELEPVPVTRVSDIDELAEAGFSYDDGKAVGIYWLATLPEHRSHGLARAIMKKVLAAHPDRTATLVSTEAGEPLYRSLGFVTVSTSVWYALSRTG